MPRPTTKKKKSHIYIYIYVYFVGFALSPRNIDLGIELLQATTVLTEFDLQLFLLFLEKWLKTRYLSN